MNILIRHATTADAESIALLSRLTFYDTFAAFNSKEDMDKGALQYPLGYGQPLDVAGMVMYLLSDISKWVTGTDMILDGGLTLK